MSAVDADNVASVDSIIEEVDPVPSRVAREVCTPGVFDENVLNKLTNPWGVVLSDGTLVAASALVRVRESVVGWSEADSLDCFGKEVEAVVIARLVEGVEDVVVDSIERVVTRGVVVSAVIFHCKTNLDCLDTGSDN